MDAKLRKPAAGLLAVAALALYWPVGETEFTLDDRDFVVENESLRTPSTAVAALTRSFPPAQQGRALYRPVTHAVYALEWTAFGERARAYHGISALLHAVTAVLLFALLDRYRIALPWAFAAAFAFALHPIHSEVAASVAGHSELLSLGFALAALLAFDRAIFEPDGARPRRAMAPGAQLLALIAFALAALSKESGLMTSAAIATRLAIAHRSDPERLPLRRAATDLAPFVAVGLGVLALRIGVVGRLSPDPSTYAFSFANGFERIATFGGLYLEYLRLLVWPDPLQIDFHYERAIGIRRAVDARVVSGWIALAGSLGALAAVARRALRAGTDPRGPAAAAALGLVWATALLVLVSHAVDIGALMAERFLFAPTAGLALAAAAGLEALAPRSTRARVALAAVLVLVVLASVPHTRARSRAWRDPLLLWSAYVDAQPGDARGWSSLAALRMQRDDLDGSRDALDRALALAPDDYGTRLNEAEWLRRAGRPGKAEHALLEMTQSGGVDQRAWLALARIAATRGQLAVARDRAERALALQPNFVATHALIERLDTDLASRRRYVDAHLPELETSGDAAMMRTLAGACRAVSDTGCERRAIERARTLEGRDAGGDEGRDEGRGGKP